MDNKSFHLQTPSKPWQIPRVKTISSPIVKVLHNGQHNVNIENYLHSPINCNNDSTNFQKFSTELLSSNRDNNADCTKNSSHINKHNNSSSSSKHQLLTIANLARLHRILQPNKDVNAISSSADAAGTDTTFNITNNHNNNNGNKNNFKTNLETISIASSTHFTMVNGFGAAHRKIQHKKACCCCNSVVGVIITMTTIFVVLIFGIILFAEYPRMMANISKKS